MGVGREFRSRPLPQSLETPVISYTVCLLYILPIITLSVSHLLRLFVTQAEAGQINNFVKVFIYIKVNWIYVLLCSTRLLSNPTMIFFFKDIYNVFKG